MLNITDAAAFARALDSPLDPELKRLLILRRDQLLTDTGGEYELGDLVHFIVVEPGDGICAVEAAANYPLLTEPAFEWAVDHGGHIEAATVLSDDGFGIVLVVPQHDGIDRTVLTLLRDVAASANANTVQRLSAEHPVPL